MTPAQDKIAPSDERQRSPSPFWARGCATSVAMSSMMRTNSESFGVYSSHGQLAQHGPIFVGNNSLDHDRGRDPEFAKEVDHLPDELEISARQDGQTDDHDVLMVGRIWVTGNNLLTSLSTGGTFCLIGDEANFLARRGSRRADRSARSRGLPAGPGAIELAPP
jgi:hypothetical protein